MNGINQKVEGIIDFNEILYENEFNKEYIFLVSRDISWYVYNIKDKNFNILDKTSGELMETYNDFYFMFDNIFYIIYKINDKIQIVISSVIATLIRLIL